MSGLYVMVTVTDRNRSILFRKLFEEKGATVSFTTFGRGTATSEILDAFGLEAWEKAVIHTLVTYETFQVIKKDLDLRHIAQMVKTRIEVFPDIREHIDFFEELPEYDIEMYVHKKMKTTLESSLSVLKEVLPLLSENEDFSNDALFALLTDYAAKKEVKTGYVMWPIRTAVSGKQTTPGGATELMEILGKEESLERIKKGIEKLS